VTSKGTLLYHLQRHHKLNVTRFSINGISIYFSRSLYFLAY